MTFDLVFWQNTLSIHQAPFLKQVAEQLPAYGGARVVLNVETGINTERKAMGWIDPDYGNVQVNIGTNRPPSSELRLSDQHVFSGFGETQTNRMICRHAIFNGYRPLISLETPRQDQPIKKIIRGMKYRYLSFRNRSADFSMLPKGQMGVQFFNLNGFKKRDMQEFAYFPQADAELSKYSLPRTSAVKFVFVGSLWNLKNLAYILSILASLKDRPWSLDVVGIGPLAESHKKFVQQAGIADRITFWGPLPNHKAQKKMQQCDYLVLPSLYDGWGAVVNESLLMGTPVLVSSTAGASSLIRDPRLGFVIDVKDRLKTRSILETVITKGSVSDTQRLMIKQWAEQMISPKSGASYFLDLVAAHRSGKFLSSVPVPWHVPIL